MSKELDKILRGINEKHAKSTTDTKPIIVRGSDVKDTLAPKFQPIGIEELDNALGGGIPLGTVSTFYGDKGTGKTALALMLVAAVQKNGGVCVWIDAEPPFPYLTALLVGVDLDSLYIINPKDYGEQILDVVRELLFDSKNRITRSEVQLIVADSLNGLIPKAQVNSTEEKGSEGHTIGRRAAMLSKWLEELSGRAFLREGAILFNIAQTRVDINAYGAPEKMSGGKAVEFLSKVVVKVTKKRIEGGDPMSGHEVQFKVEKNNIVGRLAKGAYQVVYGVGVNDAQKVIATAMELGLIRKIKGSNYRVYTEKQTLDITGIGNVRSTITNSVELKKELKTSIENGFLPKEDESLENEE